MFMTLCEHFLVIGRADQVGQHPVPPIPRATRRTEPRRRTGGVSQATATQLQVVRLN